MLNWLMQWHCAQCFLKRSRPRSTSPGGSMKSSGTSSSPKARFVVCGKETPGSDEDSPPADMLAQHNNSQDVGSCRE